jgi:hypothetical protein
MLRCPKCHEEFQPGKLQPATTKRAADDSGNDRRLPNDSRRADEPARREQPAAKEADDERDDRRPSKRSRRDNDDLDDKPSRKPAAKDFDDELDDRRPSKSRRRDDDDGEDKPRRKSAAAKDDDEPDDRRPSKSRRRDEDDEDDKPRRKSAAAKDDDDEGDDRRSSKSRRRDDDDEDDTPSRPAKADFGKSQLFGEKKWMLHKKERIFASKAFPYRCEFYRPHAEGMAGVVQERCNRFLKFFFGGIPVIGKFLSIKLDVRDGDGKPLLFVIRIPGFRFPKFNLTGLLEIFGIKNKTVEILDADGEFVCSFVMPLISLTPKFTVYDAREQIIAEFRFKTLDMKKGTPPRMCLLSPDGEEWGSVTGEDEAKMMEGIKAGKKVIVTGHFFRKAGLMASVNPSGDRPITKQMLLAAAIAMRIFNIHKIFEQK